MYDNISCILRPLSAPFSGWSTSHILGACRLIFKTLDKSFIGVETSKFVFLGLGFEWYATGDPKV